MASSIVELQLSNSYEPRDKNGVCFEVVRRHGSAQEHGPLQDSPPHADGDSVRLQTCAGGLAEKWPRSARLCNKIFRPQLDTHIDPSFVLLVVLVYGILYFSMGSAFLPGHAAWCTVLMWACSLVGATLAHWLYLPRVIGMLAAGMLLENIPWDAITAFPPKWGTQMRAAALATIFLRCGLELDVGTMRRFKFPAIRLALLPGLAEALFDAGLGVAFFKMDFLLGLTMGFILKAVGPGLVVPAMFRLQKALLGTDQGIPATVVISASFDDAIAITGYAIFSTIAIQPDNGSGTQSSAWSIASGPSQVVFGILGGLLFGIAVGATRLWNTRLKRGVAIYGSCLLLMFFLVHWNLLSGGALAALFTGLIASNAWERGSPRFASLGPSFQFSPEIERWMGIIWNWVMEPILFVTVGATINFSKLAPGTIPKSVAIVCCGVVLRMIVTVCVMSGFGYTSKEKAFYAIAWTPKATVQAALSAAPLALIHQFKACPPNPDPACVANYEQWVDWGNDILTTGLFAIIICGTLGVMAIHYSAPQLLELAGTSEEEKEGGHPVGMPAAPAGETLGEAAPAALVTAERVAPSEGTTMQAVSSSGPSYRPASPTFDQLITGEDTALVAEFIDAIRVLTSALQSGQYTREEVLRLSDHVQHVQKRIETDVGRREPSVRELFRTASALAAQRPLVVHRGGASRSTAFVAGKVADDSV